MPSCTPATATRSHSRPFAACAVSRRTAAPRSAVGAMVSAGRSWASTWSRKTSVRAPGSRSVNRAAASKRTSTASRSRSAASARRRRARSPSPASGRPWLIAPAHRSARPLACQTAQSTSSAVAPGRAAASRAMASSPATACAGSAQRRSMPANSSGSCNASTISSPEGRRSPPANASARRPCRSRRSASGSAPPSGECSSATADSSSSRSGSSAQRSRSSSGATAGCRCRGRSSPCTTVGTPAACSARRKVGSCNAVDRTSTAIRDQGTPSSRWAERSAWASQAASLVAERKVCTSTTPGGASGRGCSRRCAAGPRSRRPSRAIAASRPGPARYDVVSSTCAAGAPDAVRNRCGNVATPAGSAPRKAYVEESGSANATSDLPPPAMTESSSSWAGSVSASSSR
ncbi:Platelet binding protein GspB [Micromonospora saelicesensis]|uniref:Platelet binding protein GspB n=1 Tax=Micromonospora saelicesensis TaxID=285676 RepID=A0ABX9CGA4_9ACTN|nr:Platelet binding protein GspB [Micromonospora saelicesensis]